MIIKVTSHNIDFNNGLKAQNEDVDADTENSDVYLVQEARDTILSRLLNRGWRNNQRTTSAAKRGTAVAWRISKFAKRRTGIRLGTDNRGVRMHPRWISWANLRVKGTKKTIKFISIHNAPKRFKFLQPAMVAVAVAMVKASRVPVVLAGDFNFLVHNDPYNISKRTGLVRRGHGIDGFYVSKSLKPGSIQVAEKANSDHKAVSIFITVDED